MEAQTDMQTYLEQGKSLLAQGQGREAAIAYAHAAQLEPTNPVARLGLAEANMALGNYDIVRQASRDVQRLEPADGLESMTAQALVDVLDRRYDRALQQVESVIAQNPGIAYIHALRSYLLRLQRQDYDANLARARAARLSYGGRFENVFPPAEPAAPIASSYASRTTPTNSSTITSSHPYETGYTSQVDQRDRVDESPYGTQQTTPTQQRQEQEQIPAWTPPNRMRRQMIRTRFTLSQYPSLLTYALIIINVIVFVFTTINPNLIDAGAQVNAAVVQGEYWRLFTAMFIHLDIFHIGFNMLSLFFVGRAVEIFYGKWRYLLIYLLSGILGGIAFLFFAPSGSAAGASGAIFGIFGAFGVFFIVNRRSLGVYGRGAISNWVFWLGLNLVYGLLPGSSIAIQAHIGGLIAGMILGFLLVPRLSNRRRI